MAKTKKSKASKNLLAESNLSRLNKALLLAGVQKEMEEPGYTPIGRITRNRRVIQRRQEYCSDIERALNEAELTTSLMSGATKEKKIEGKIFQPEEIVNYYNGVFLDQVHQIRDKLFRMVALLLLDLETAQENQKKDPKELKYKPFVNKNKEQLEKIGIYELLTKWYLDGQPIKVVVDKRTQHHHRVSTLKLNSDYQEISMTRLMLNPTAINHLSEYGKKKLTEIGEKAFKKWRGDIVKKQRNTIEEINQNIEEISTKLLSHLDIPSEPKVIADIVNRYTEFLSSMDVENEANIQKIQEEIRPLIDGLIDIAKNEFGDVLHSVYLVGSCGRGEFIPGSSDMNVYFIINKEGEIAISRDQFPLLNATFITIDSFRSERHKRDRFICWSDGVLLFGSGVQFDKKEFPKPGTLLTLLLNRGSLKKLEDIKNEVAKLEKPDAKTLRSYTLKAAKIIMDWDFGVAIANKPFYTASRKGKLKYIKESWPSGRRTATIEQLYLKNNSVRQEDFPILVDSFLKNAKPNYQKLLDVEKEVLKGSSN